RVATDGSWVRNYPLGYAYERPEVEQIVGFRYEPQYPVVGAGVVASIAQRLRRYARLPAARALHRELEEALAREQRGQPAHIVDVFSRLSQVAIIRNTVLEEVVADWRDQSIQELAGLREGVRRIVEEAELPDRERSRLVDEIDERFAQAKFPFRHDRAIPRITVAASAGQHSLEPGFRNPTPWTVDAKQALIDDGHPAAAAEPRAPGV